MMRWHTMARSTSLEMMAWPPMTPQRQDAESLRMTHVPCMSPFHCTYLAVASLVTPACLATLTNPARQDDQDDQQKVMTPESQVSPLPWIYSAAAAAVSLAWLTNLQQWEDDQHETVPQEPHVSPLPWTQVIMKGWEYGATSMPAWAASPYQVDRASRMPSWDAYA